MIAGHAHGLSFPCSRPPPSSVQAMRFEPPGGAAPLSTENARQVAAAAYFIRCRRCLPMHDSGCDASGYESAVLEFPFKRRRAGPFDYASFSARLMHGVIIKLPLVVVEPASPPRRSLPRAKRSQNIAAATLGCQEGSANRRS